MKNIENIKNINLLNCPQARLIKRYWAIMKSRLKTTKKRVDSIDPLKNSWKRCKEKQDKVNNMTVQTLKEGIKKKIRPFWRG